jgi:hypothetical protein
MAEEQAKERREKLKSKLAFAALSFTAIILFLAVIGAAVWRAYSENTAPPTPTIPAGLEPSFGYVSAVEGQVQSQLPGIEIPVSLNEGDTVAAGPGALVRTAAGGWLRMGFVNGASFFLDADSEIELRQIAEAEGELNETIAQLNYGRLLVEPGSAADQLVVVVEAPTGAQVRTEQGVVGVQYDPSAQRLEAHCLVGNCMLLSQAGQELALAEGEASAVQGFSAPFDIEPAAYELFEELGDPGTIPTATATQEDTTATASPTREEPTPTAVTLEATEPLPTFTPRPSPTLQQFATPTGASGGLPTATAEDEQQPTLTLTATATAGITETVTVTVTPALESTVTNTPPPTLTGTPENAAGHTPAPSPTTTAEAAATTPGTLTSTPEND